MTRGISKSEQFGWVRFFLTASFLAACPIVLACNKAHLVSRVQEYRDARMRGDLAAEAKFIAPDARVWFEDQHDAGKPLGVGKSGRFAHWDEVFRAQSTLSEWSVKGNAVSATVLESNDYYRLIERQPRPYRMTWWLDDDERITGVLIESQPGTAKSRMGEFREWAIAHHPEELDYLMPGGELDPTGDRAERWKAILIEWRAFAGLPGLE